MAIAPGFAQSVISAHSGVIHYTEGKILVDDKVPLRPRLVAVVARGRLVHMTDATRLIHAAIAPRKAVAAA